MVGVGDSSLKTDTRPTSVDWPQPPGAVLHYHTNQVNDFVTVTISIITNIRSIK